MTSAAVVLATSASAWAVTLSGPGYSADVLIADCDDPDAVANTGASVACGSAARSDLTNINLGTAGDGHLGTNFYSLGFGGTLLLEFTPDFLGGPNTGTVVEVTNIGSGTVESANLWVSTSFNSVDLTGFTFVTNIDNTDDGGDRRNTTLVDIPAGSWTYLALVDTSSNSEDGFDVDALSIVPGGASTEIPLPASVLFLLSGLGALAAVRRRRA
jgi:hypothetical protein